METHWLPSVDEVTGMVDIGNYPYPALREDCIKITVRQNIRFCPANLLITGDYRYKYNNQKCNKSPQNKTN